MHTDCYFIRGSIPLQQASLDDMLSNSHLTKIKNIARQENNKYSNKFESDSLPVTLHVGISSIERKNHEPHHANGQPIDLDKFISNNFAFNLIKKIIFLLLICKNDLDQNFNRIKHKIIIYGILLSFSQFKVPKVPCQVPK